MANYSTVLVALIGALTTMFSVAEGQQVTTLTLQADEIPTNTSLARWIGKAMPEMTSYTVCMYLKTLRARKGYDTTISYAVERNFNEIYMGFTFPSGVFEIWWDYDLVARARVPNGLLKWWRLCYMLDMNEGIFVLYWNDQIFSKPITVPKRIRGGGIFILGQDQDDMNSGFSMAQSFHGIIGDFQLYDRLLSKQEALDFVGCRSRNTHLKPVIDFSDFVNQWELEGSVDVGRMPLSSICESDNGVLVMFPEPRLFPESLSLCHNLDGTIHAPGSGKENQNVLTYVTPHISKCKDGNGNIIHLGVRGDVDTETYIYYTNGSRLYYNNLSSLKFIDDFYCMGYLMTVGSEGQWYQSRCEVDSLCTLCHFEDVTYIKVRGLCTDSLFDSTMLLRGIVGETPEFQGFYYSHLQLIDEQWELTYLPDQSINATMIATVPDQYPIGRHDWLMRGDLCSIKEETLVPLVFTTCKVGEFTCNDGSCVNIGQRCDFILDCPDFSDEAECDLVMIPKSYIPQLPPQMEDGSAVVVNISSNITSIRAFSLLDLMFAFDIIVAFTWKDSRLTFSNVKENTEMNLISRDSMVWRPDVFYEEGSGSKVDVTERVSQAYVERKTMPLPDATTRLKEDEHYEGRHNNIIDLRTLTVTSNCLFDLSMYPFDVQKCQVIIRSVLGARSVRLNTTGVNFVGERRLLEYNVDEVKSENTESDGLSEVKIYIKFVNLYNYYISGTYVPTTLLLTITYLTFYFPLNDFTDRIMVSLTALLVLAALFLQTNQSMPRTAYLKLVDVWFVFCITMDFIIVVLLVVINYLHENIAVFVTPKVSAKNTEVNPRVRTKRMTQYPWILNTLSRVVIPLGFFFFTIGYLGYTVANWEG